MTTRFGAAARSLKIRGVRRSPQRTAAMLAGAILAPALLVAGCASPGESLPTDGGLLSLASMEFSCGAGRFPLAALSGPASAERAADAPAAALRSIVTAPAVAGPADPTRGGLPIARQH
jgi:hypothetical protein